MCPGHCLHVLVLRQGHLRVQQALRGWEWWAVDPPGTLRPWLPQEQLPAEIHDIWCRPGPVSFEVDGVDYTFRKGLPYPTGEDGAPDSLQILAMAPAVMGEIDQWDGQVPLGAPEGEVLELVAALYDGDPPEYRREARYGAAMIGVFTRITRNVLHRFLKETR
jgi:hypothetical protein